MDLTPASLISNSTKAMSLSLTWNTFSRKEMMPGFLPFKMKSTPRMCKFADIKKLVNTLTVVSYGSFAFNYGVNSTDFTPKEGSIYQPQGAMLFYSDNDPLVEFVFSDSPSGQYLGTYSAYTARKINVTYACESHRVIVNGTGLSDLIGVEGIGTVQLSQTVPNSTTYFTNSNRVCESGRRCSVVEAFESYPENPWYYKVSKSNNSQPP